MAFVKRAVVYGLPMLVGAGYFADSTEEGGGGEAGESGTQYGIGETAREIRNGIELTISYSRTGQEFTGTIRNTTNQAVRQVRVEVHLSNGVELGPTPNVDLAPRQVRLVELDASSQTFTGFSAHVEIGSSEHTGGGNGEHGTGSGGEGGRGGEHGSGGESGGEHGSGGEGREGGG